MPSPFLVVQQSSQTNLWQRLDELLSEASLIAPERRERWLAELPPEDQKLALAVRALLEHAATETDGYVRQPVSAALRAEADANSEPEQPGTTLGSYRLIRKLGAGGMGTVWLAERSDSSLCRQVAIKLPRFGWAPGVTERLRQERDALAALEHPNIARLYDAGTTENGRPYLVMEYVDGTPLDRYLLDYTPSLKDRLALFLQVARAVSYAHARLIIHRDLKPSNILVTMIGEVRLLDFGAAKLLAAETDLTQQIGQGLSPDYASPEQIRDERVTVGWDVYSLGIVLFELLTGRRPYRLPRGGAAELETAIARLDVPTASSRAIADPKRARELRGDLDTIIAKALKSDPAERYCSVEAFAEDISRYLAGKPVLAQADSTAYRTRKFVRRHSLGVSAAAAIVLALGIGGAVALWQAGVARAEAARTGRVKQFIASIFTQATPREGVGGVVTASGLLSAATDRLEKELSLEPAVAAELSIIIAESFSSLGEPEKGEQLLRTAIVRVERNLGRSHPETLRAKTMLASKMKLHDVRGALELLDEVIPDALMGLPATAAVAVEALEQQALLLTTLDRKEASYIALRQAIDIGEKYLGPLNEHTVWGLGMLANAYGRFGDRAGQLAMATEALSRGHRAFSDLRPHNVLIDVERWYGDALRTNDRPGDAIPILRRALSDQELLDVTPTMCVREVKLGLARALLASGRTDEALPMVRETVDLEQRQNPAESDDRRNLGDALVTALALAYRTDEALAEDDRVNSLVSRLGIEPRRAAVGRRIRRAWLLALQGHPGAAEQAAREAAQLAGGEEPSLRAEAALASAFNARLQLRLPNALETLEHLAMDDRLDSYPLALQAAIAAELGTVLLEIGNDARAKVQLSQCRELFARAQIQPSAAVSVCLVGSARLALRAGRAMEAEQLLAPLAHFWERVNPDSPWRGETLYWLSLARAANGEASAYRDAKAGDSLLSRSNVPVLRRLIDHRLAMVL